MNILQEMEQLLIEKFFNSFSEEIRLVNKVPSRSKIAINSYFSPKKVLSLALNFGKASSTAWLSLLFRPEAPTILSRVPMAFNNVRM